MKRKPTETFRNQSFFPNELQIYVNRAAEDFHLPLHNHEFIELAYIMEGSGFHYTEDTVERVQNGELCFIPIGMSHVFRPLSANTDKHPLVVYNCIFTPQLLVHLASFCTSNSLKSFIEALGSKDAAYFSIRDNDRMMERIFQSLFREYTIPQTASSDALTASLLQLLIIMHRTEAEENANHHYEPLTQFDQLLRYIHQHCTEELSLTKLSLLSQWSERQLQRLFQKHAKQTFSRYVQSLRIQKSRELLRSTQHKISTIAQMVGYQDIGHFQAVFKRITGMTPAQYRKDASM